MKSDVPVRDAAAYDYRAFLDEMDGLKRRIELLENRVRLLTEENALLGEMLRERGVDMHPLSETSEELPAVLETPIERSGEIWDELMEEGKKLLEEASGGADIFMLVRTGARIDTGNWLANGTVWVIVMKDALGLFAAGAKPYVEHVPFRFLRDSLYNHVTGELVLAPAHGAKVRFLKMSPADGYQMLAQIYNGKEGGSDA